MSDVPRGAVVIWLAALAVFVALALLASAHDTFPGDGWLVQRIQEFDWKPWTQAMDLTEDLAQMPLIALITPAAAIIGLLFVPRLSALLIPATLLFRPLNPLLKDLVERPRPSPDDVHVAPGQPGDFSFPSGHAMAAMLLYGLLFYLATVHVKRAWARVPLQLACAWVIVVTGFERVYSGSHWPSDVLGGYLIGALIMGALAAVDRLVNTRRAR